MSGMPTTESEILAVEERLRVAMLASDVAALDHLIAPELVFTNHLGEVFGKQDDLQLHRSGVLRLHAIEPSERLVRVLDGLAVVSLLVALSGEHGGSRFEASLRYTRVWRRSEHGDWQIVAGHCSMVPGGRSA